MQASTPQASSWTQLRSHVSGPHTLGLILLFALVIRLWGLTEESPILDELHSIWASDTSRSWGHFFRALVVNETHLPAYFLLLRGWMWLGGVSEAWIRLLSVLIGVAGVWAMASLGTRLRERGFGLLLAALTAVFYFHVEQSQTIRFYAQVFALQAFSMAFFVGLLQGDRQRKTWAGWLVSSALGLCTFYYFIFVVVAQGVLLVIELAKQRRLLTRETTLRWLPAFACLAAVTFVFLLLSPQSFTESLNSRYSSLGFGLGFQWYWNNFTAWFGPADPPMNRWAPFYGQISLVLWVLAILVLSIRHLTHSAKTAASSDPSIASGRLTVLVGVGVLIVVTALAVAHSTLAGQPVFQRHMVIALPAMLLLLAEALWVLPYERLRPWAIALVLGWLTVNTLLVPGQHTGLKENWRQAAMQLSLRMDKSPVISHIDELYNTMAKSLKLKTHAYNISSPTAESTLRTGGGFWLLQLSYYPYSTPLLDSALAQRFVPVVRYNDINRLMLTYYQARTGTPTLLRLADTHRAERIAFDPSSSNAPFEGWLDVLDSIAPTERSFLGWGRIKDYAPPGDVSVELILSKDSLFYAVPTFRSTRIDIRHDVLSGFEGKLSLEGLPPGSYRLGVLVRDLYRQRQAYSGPVGSYTIQVR